MGKSAPRTLYDKIWDDHMVDQQPDGTCLLYIDRHLVHEVTSPQAFEGLRMTGRTVRRAGKNAGRGRSQRPAPPTAPRAFDRCRKRVAGGNTGKECR